MLQGPGTEPDNFSLLIMDCLKEITALKGILQLR